MLFLLLLLPFLSLLYLQFLRIIISFIVIISILLAWKLSLPVPISYHQYFKHNRVKNNVYLIPNYQTLQYNCVTVTVHRQGVHCAAASCAMLDRREATHLLANSIIRPGLPASIPEMMYFRRWVAYNGRGCLILAPLITIAFMFKGII